MILLTGVRLGPHSGGIGQVVTMLLSHLKIDYRMPPQIEHRGQTGCSGALVPIHGMYSMEDRGKYDRHSFFDSGCSFAYGSIGVVSGTTVRHSCRASLCMHPINDSSTSIAIQSGTQCIAIMRLVD